MFAIRIRFKISLIANIVTSSIRHLLQDDLSSFFTFYKTRDQVVTSVVTCVVKQRDTEQLEGQKETRFHCEKQQLFALSDFVTGF